jgi:hypothetical protein
MVVTLSDVSREADPNAILDWRRMLHLSGLSTGPHAVAWSSRNLVAVMSDVVINIVDCEEYLQTCLADYAEGSVGRSGGNIERHFGDPEKDSFNNTTTPTPVTSPSQSTAPTSGATGEVVVKLNVVDYTSRKKKHLTPVQVQKMCHTYAVGRHCTVLHAVNSQLKTSRFTSVRWDDGEKSWGLGSWEDGDLDGLGVSSGAWEQFLLGMTDEEREKLLNTRREMSHARKLADLKQKLEAEKTAAENKRKSKEVFVVRGGESLTGDDMTSRLRRLRNGLFEFRRGASDARYAENLARIAPDVRWAVRVLYHPEDVAEHTVEILDGEPDSDEEDSDEASLLTDIEEGSNGGLTPIDGALTEDMLTEHEDTEDSEDAMTEASLDSLSAFSSTAFNDTIETIASSSRRGKGRGKAESNNTTNRRGGGQNTGTTSNGVAKGGSKGQQSREQKGKGRSRGTGARKGEGKGAGRGSRTTSRGASRGPYGDVESQLADAVMELGGM